MAELKNVLPLVFAGGHASNALFRPMRVDAPAARMTPQYLGSLFMRKKLCFLPEKARHFLLILAVPSLSIQTAERRGPILAFLVKRWGNA